VLRGIAAALDGEAAYPSLDGALATLSDLEAAVERVRRDGVSRSATAEQVGRMFGIAHAFEQLRTDLKDLANRAREFETRGASPALGAQRGLTHDLIAKGMGRPNLLMAFFGGSPVIQRPPAGEAFGLALGSIRNTLLTSNYWTQVRLYVEDGLWENRTNERSEPQP
jgi:hypothetical protein